MKNIKYLYIVTLLMGASISSQIEAATYFGNGGTGFGGAIGSSSLEITDDGTSLFFGLTRGSSDLNDMFVLYLNSQTGGLSNNTTISDGSDIYHQAISGCAGGSCVNINFGFDADYAVAFGTQGGANLFSLNGDGSLSLISILGGNGQPTDSSYNFELLFSDINMPKNSGQNIEFVGTYININVQSAFLSNEGYGAGLPNNNPGSLAATFSSSELYATSAVPIPAAGWLFGSGFIGLIGLARRKRLM